MARGCDGQAVCYPVALNRHERHILDTTLMPAPGRADRRPGSSPAGPVYRPGSGHRRRPDRRVLPDIGRAASGQRDCSSPAQLGTPDDRGGRHQPVRAAGAGPLRIASGPDRPGHAGGDGQPARRLVGSGGRRAALGRRASGSIRASRSTSTASGRRPPAEKWAT